MKRVLYLIFISFHSSNRPVNDFTFYICIHSSKPYSVSSLSSRFFFTFFLWSWILSLHVSFTQSALFLLLSFTFHAISYFLFWILLRMALNSFSSVLFETLWRVLILFFVFFSLFSCLRNLFFFLFLLTSLPKQNKYIEIGRALVCMLCVFMVKFVHHSRFHFV